MFEAYAKIPMVILGFQFLEKQEKVLLSILINQKNVYRSKSKEFTINKGRLQMYMGMQSRGIIKIVNEKLEPKKFVENFGESGTDFYVELSDWGVNPLILYTSAVMESMKLKRQQFTRKSENDAWEILSRITQEEVMNNVTSLEDANRLVSTKLANIQTIQAVQQDGKFSIKILCEIAEIPRSSYYKWLNRKPSVRELENQRLTKAMISLHEKVGGIYGYRRLTLHLCKETEQQINHKRIQRLMQLQGIQSVTRRRKRKKYTASTPQHVAENLLNREFTATKPNEKWVTDVTEF